MDVRNGKYLDENEMPTEEFCEIVAEYENRLEKDFKATELPDNPDYNKIDRLVAEINTEILDRKRRAAGV